MEGRNHIRIFGCKTLQPLIYDVCGQFISSGGFLHHRRCFGYHVLIMVTEGTLHITSNQVPYSLTAGQYLLLKAGEEHFGHQPSAGRLSYLWVHFTADCEFEEADSSEHQAYLFRECGSYSASGRVSLLFQQLMDLSLDEKFLSQHMRNYALSLLVMELSRECMQKLDNGKEQFPAVVRSVMEWIKVNYYQSFTVSQLGDQFGYQADYLSSLFKKTVGISIVQYTNQIRMKSAKTLLLNYDISIKEAAYSCGFSDEKYFMKVFKQHEGMTPTQYKRMFSRNPLHEIFL